MGKQIHRHDCTRGRQHASQWARSPVRARHDQSPLVAPNVAAGTRYNPAPSGSTQFVLTTSTRKSKIKNWCVGQVESVGVSSAVGLVCWENRLEALWCKGIEALTLRTLASSASPNGRVRLPGPTPPDRRRSASAPKPATSQEPLPPWRTGSPASRAHGWTRSPRSSAVRRARCVGRWPPRTTPASRPARTARRYRRWPNPPPAP
jgi:hypothetical protein